MDSPVISKTAELQLELFPNLCSQCQRWTSASPEWVRVWQSGKLLGWKGLDKSFPAPGEFQGWNCMEKSSLSEKTKDACGTFGSTSQLSLHLLSLLFLAAVLGESSWSVDFTAQPVGKFHQGGFLHAWWHGQGSASHKKRGESEVWAPVMAFPPRITWNCEKEAPGWILQWSLPVLLLLWDHFPLVTLK